MTFSVSEHSHATIVPRAAWHSSLAASPLQKTLKVRLNGGAAPATGASAEVLRYFESKPGEASPLGILGGLLGGTVSGWVVVAGAKVDKIDKDTVTLTISEERSTMMVNGKKVNHFSPGARMKLSVARAPKP
jgi:hypothetical protein